MHLVLKIVVSQPVNDQVPIVEFVRKNQIHQFLNPGRVGYSIQVPVLISPYSQGCFCKSGTIPVGNNAIIPGISDLLLQITEDNAGMKAQVGGPVMLQTFVNGGIMSKRKGTLVEVMIPGFIHFPLASPCIG